MRKSNLGEQESTLLAWVASHTPASTAQIIKGYGIPQGLARTTVTTMLDRLCAKGYLTRKKEGVSFVYTPQEEHQTQLSGVVGRFIERTLSGSLDPFVAYLGATKLNATQKAQLRALVEKLDDELPEEEETP